MCDPAIMGGIGLVGNIAGAFGAYGASRAQAQLQRQLGQAQKNAYDAAASVSEMNADMTFKAAEVAVDQGSFALDRLKQKGQSVMSSQRAAMGASGIATTDGTPALILSDTAANLAQDVEAMRLNNRRTKWGYDVQATNYRNQAAQQRYAGAAALAGADYQAAATEQAATTSLLSSIQASAFKAGDMMGAFGATKTSKKKGGRD